MDLDGIRVVTTHTYTVHLFGRRVDATVSRDIDDIGTWVHEIYNMHAPRIAAGTLVAGIGVQWRPGSGQGGLEPTAVVQVSVGHRCLLVQLCRCREVPRALMNFLADGQVTFVGVGIDDDVRRLGLVGLRVGNPRELRKLAVAKYGGLNYWSNASMGALADRVLGFTGVTKDGRVSRSEWDALHLSDEQVRYACQDAYLAFLLGMELLHG